MKEILLPRSNVTISFDARNKPTIEVPFERESCNDCSSSDCNCEADNQALDVLESFLLAIVTEFASRRMFSTHRTELIAVLDEAILTTQDAIAFNLVD